MNEHTRQPFVRMWEDGGLWDAAERACNALQLFRAAVLQRTAMEREGFVFFDPIEPCGPSLLSWQVEDVEIDDDDNDGKEYDRPRVRITVTLNPATQSDVMGMERDSQRLFGIGAEEALAFQKAMAAVD